MAMAFYDLFELWTQSTEKNILVAVIYQFEHSNWTCLSLLSFRLTNKIIKKLKIMVLLIEFIATTFFYKHFKYTISMCAENQSMKNKENPTFFPSFFNCQNECAKKPGSRLMCVQTFFGFFRAVIIIISAFSYQNRSFITFYRFKVNTKNTNRKINQFFFTLLFSFCCFVIILFFQFNFAVLSWIILNSITLNFCIQRTNATLKWNNNFT